MSVATEQNERITPEVEIFLRRAVPHFMAGKSVEDSFRTVLDDDQRLFDAIHDKSRSFYMPTADDRGRAYTTGERKGDLIASELARTVYARLRAEQSA